MYFPKNQNMDDYPIQSRVFGHRLKDDQTIYEYLLEFLQVVISPKKISGKEHKEFFPLCTSVDENEIEFFPVSRIGLKRYIFFDKSKHETRFPADEYAYEECIDVIKARIHVETHREFINKEYVCKILQNLLYGFSAVTKNRSWFAQSLLPICPEVILPETMGVKSKRKNIKWKTERDKIDNEFAFHNYNFMARGGEVYYLHVLKSLNQNPGYKNEIEKGFMNLISSFPEFSIISNFINETWVERYAEEIKPISKTLGCIPDGFDIRSRYTVIELENFLRSDIHPFEKIDILSVGVILQIIRMMHEQASKVNNLERPVWVVDINCKGELNNEVKKIAIKNFANNEENIIKALYMYLNDNTIKVNKDAYTTMSDASKDTYKLYRKIGKAIGIIIPIKGAGMRFTFSEKVIKFLVLSLISPSTKLTLDSFIQKIHCHYGIVIGREQYKIEMDRDGIEEIGDLTFMDRNKAAFIQKLKDCGFLRTLSDSTSIVENPYSVCGGLCCE